MSYDAVAKALYDYDAQDPDGELSFKEDQILYIIDKEDDECVNPTFFAVDLPGRELLMADCKLGVWCRVNRWWKAKIKPLDDAPEADEDKVGLVPRTYVEEVSWTGKPALVCIANTHCL